MSINNSFHKQFGKNAAPSNDEGQRPKAEFWMNMGYTVQVSEDESKFVSLPTGIPLDTQEPVSTNSSNEEFRMLRCAQNDLLEQVMEFAKTLKPGEERILDLQIQLRRVKAEKAPVEASANPYAVKLNFGS